MAKLKVILAVLIYLLSVLHILDWIYFWNQNKALAAQDHAAFKLKYFHHFPEFLQPMLTISSRLEGFVLMILLVISGIILTREKNLLIRIIGINAFVFSAWYLFGLM